MVETGPKISVLMTVYNGGTYLKRSIQSVLQQSFTDFELLIVNDASTDDTLATIGSFRDERIRVYTNDRNMGQSRSLNKGVYLAKGQYVARIDADDIAFPHWLKEQYAFMESNAGYAVVSGRAVVIDENDRIRRIYGSPEKRDDVILRSFTFSPVNHVGCLFDRKTVLEYGGYVEQYKIAADYGLWSNLIRHGQKITSNTKILVAIRAHSSSLSRSSSGPQELKDLSDIMRANINEFTEAKITEDESVVLCRAFFDEGSLNESEFNYVLDILKKVYGRVLPLSAIDQKLAHRWLKNRSMAVYLKRVFYFIEKEDYAAVKAVLRRGVDEYGWFSSLGVLLLARSLGRVFLRSLPAFHERVMTAKAYIRTVPIMGMVG